MTRLSSPRLWVAFATLLVTGSIVGLWRSSTGAEQAIRDATDAALARYAGAYLGVVTPSSAGGYDLPRLVSVANTIASSSYWPGGFQLVLGNVGLITDTIELLPLSDTVTRSLSGGAANVVTTSGGYRVTLVPFAGVPGPAGAASTWNTLPARSRSLPFRLGTLLVIGGIAAAVVAWWYDPRSDRRLRVTAMATALLALAAMGLAISVRETARDATVLRLLTARTLIEIAATANGVKQARLPEIGVGLTVSELASPVTRNTAVTDVHEPGGSLAVVLAVTPRTGGGLELRMVPVEAGLGSLWWTLAAWLGLGMVGLGTGVRAAGLSAPGGLFHSRAAVVGPPTDEGRRHI